MFDRDVSGILQSQLLGLSPKQRCIAGIVIAVAGLAWFALWWSRGWIVGLGAFATLFGIAVGLQARGDLRREARVDAEVARAKKEWATLGEVLREARRSGGNPTRILQQRGYTEFFVRRWILKHVYHLYNLE